ncbi:MAG: DUF3987 domain-containing protein, partial [Bacteroidetes bacterium]|nr:DUF3987 domain-containing protein [Bacteroidota bacterium]
IPSPEDGLFSRFLYYAFAVEPIWRDVSPGENEFNLNDYFEGLSDKVLELVEYLERFPTTVLLSQDQWDLHHHVFSQILTRTTAFFGQDAKASVFRLGNIAFRIAMVFTALRKFQEEGMSQKCRCHDYDFMNAMGLVETYLEHAIFLYEKLPSETRTMFNHSINPKKALFDELPKEFKRKEAVDKAIKYGISSRTVDRLLNQLTGSSLKQSTYGHYKKI